MRSAAFSAPGLPGSARSTTVAPWAAATSAVRSLQPLALTMTWSSAVVRWSRSASRQLPMTDSSLWAAMITLTMPSSSPIPDLELGCRTDAASR